MGYGKTRIGVHCPVSMGRWRVGGRVYKRVHSHGMRPGNPVQRAL